MRLSHLEIIGFKSFANKLDIKFSDGVTAVVGPNGCGKSNIVDAIRWVLGEQRATALRGERMEDIIFNGTASRKPLGMAEVSLTIDNSEQRLPIEYSEVTITRRYFRSGDSEYFLNKVPCRLKDITDLLLDTGMGTHAYSIIEQGMVDSIVNGSALDRRHLIEEAAGINKYKSRRRLAERKLESTQQDLLRIADLLEEVERNTGSLRRQLWKFERFQRLTHDKKEVELAVVYHQYQALREQGEPVRLALEALSRDRTALTVAISAAEARMESRNLELTEKERVLREWQEEVNTCDELIRGSNERALVARTRRNGLEARLEVVSKESDTIEAEQEHMAERRTRAQEELDGMGDALEQAKTAFQERDARAQAFSTQVIGRREAMRVLQNRRLDVMSRLTEKRAEIAAIETRMDGQRNRQYDINHTRARLTTEITDFDEKGNAAQKELKAVSLLVDENRELKAEVEEASQDLQRRRESIRERLSLLDTELATKSREHSLLTRMRQQYEGYGQGVRALLVDGPSINGLQGTLADVLTVDSRYAGVIEAFLGDTSQSILSETTEDALTGIANLTDRQAGQASFLIMDRFASRTLQTVPVSDPAIIGRASDFVTLPENVRPLVVYLLSQSILVTDLDAALRLSPHFSDEAGWRLLTLAGEVVDPAGIVTGGRGAQTDAHLLSRVSRLETLEEEISGQRAEREKLGAELADVVARVNALLERRTILDRTLAEQQPRQMKIDQSVRQFDFQRTQLVEREKQLAQEADGIETQTKDQATVLKTVREAMTALVRSREEAEAADQEAQDELRQIEAENQRLSNQAQEARVTHISLESRRNELRTTAGHIGQQLERLTQTHSQRKQEITLATQQMTELNQTLAQCEEELKVLYTQRREKEVGRDTVLSTHRALQDEVRSLQNDAMEARKALTLIQDQIHGKELQDAELYMRSQEIRRSMMQQYDADPEQMAEIPMIPGLDEFDASTATAMLDDVQRKVDELGPINMAAVEEFNAAKERLDFLTQQRDDLVEAKENLEKTIIKMNRAARARFLDTFEEVRHHFMKTFQALFEGGEADLILDDGDPLEVGIDITARPRGKRLQSIALMSGGETALTAIALLFAIYLVKPSPFCVFDEVDAPLDDANVRRFASALRQFVQDTQFLVVTHNKRTMEAADFLYGITMDDPGSSRMVSVKLSGESSSDMGSIVSPDMTDPNKVEESA